MSLTEHLLRPLLATSSARPLITHYDEAAGSRVELSVATLANWAAKTANWLVEEFDVEPGDAVSVNLPAHWQSAGVLLGAWWCGAHVVANPAEARVSFVADAAEAAPTHPVALVALDPLGRGLSAPPDKGALDYLNEARLAGDEFAPLLPIPGETRALLGATVDETLGSAQELARQHGISEGDRVLSTLAWDLPDGVLRGLLAPLSAGAHIVQVTGASDDRLAKHRDTERTTTELR